MDDILRDYPRMLTPEMKPYDPLELARLTEKIVCRGDRRLYEDFYATGVYGGIATGYTVGCCLRCCFCWVSLSRDFPERYGSFHSPEQVASKLEITARKHKLAKSRISGGEPSLGKQHLLKLLELVEDIPQIKLFILETNGILFGADEDYVKSIANFEKVHVRVSIKAGTPDGFRLKTGADPRSFELPFKAIRYLIQHGARFHVAAMSADPRIMDKQERLQLAKKLWEIDPKLVINLEEEVVDPYQTTLLRLRSAGFQLEWPLKEIYAPFRKLLESR